MEHFQDLGGGPGITSPVAAGPRRTEVSVDGPEVSRSVLTHKLQHLLRQSGMFLLHLPLAGAGMEQAEGPGRHESIQMEHVFGQIQVRVLPLQVPNPVVLHPVPQDQVLSPSRSAHGVGLDETEPFDGGEQGGRREQGADDGLPAQFGNGEGHGAPPRWTV